MDSKRADPVCFRVQTNKGARRAGGSRKASQSRQTLQRLGDAARPWGLPELGGDPCSATC